MCKRFIVDECIWLSIIVDECIWLSMTVYYCGWMHMTVYFTCYFHNHGNSKSYFSHPHLSKLLILCLVKKKGNRNTNQQGILYYCLHNFSDISTSRLITLKVIFPLIFQEHVIFTSDWVVNGFLSFLYTKSKLL